MNKTLKDIQYMLACLYIRCDGSGIDAYDCPEYCTLADRYGFHINNVDEAFDIKNIYIGELRK